jgi:hypothetical protein
MNRIDTRRDTKSGTVLGGQCVFRLLFRVSFPFGHLALCFLNYLVWGCQLVYENKFVFYGVRGAFIFMYFFY